MIASQLYCARRSVESGPRLDNYSSDSIREVIGMRGGFNDAWTYDVYGQYGISGCTTNQGGYLGAQQINNALDVIPNPATGGVAGVPAGAPCARPHGRIRSGLRALEHLEQATA